MIYGITRLSCGPADVNRLLALTRMHWQIENGLHDVRDVTPGEDRCRVRKGNGSQVLAFVRNVAIYLLDRTNAPSIAAATREMPRSPGSITQIRLTNGPVQLAGGLAMNDRLRTRFLVLFCGAAFALSALWVWGLLAGPLLAGAPQDKKPEPAAKEPDEKTELAEFLDDAKHYTIRTAQPEVVLKLHESPVLNFTNPERNQELGSVFVWLNEGRPAVMGQFFRFNRGGRRGKKHALHSLAPVPLEAKFKDKVAWTPDQPGVEWKPFPAAPAVAATQKERLLQMRQLARPFRVDLIEPNEKSTELRLAPRPLYEYSVPRAGVTDGAIFSFFVATDPEAILLIEAFDEEKKSGFRYAFARFHYWQLTAKLGNKTVWDVGYDDSLINNPIGNLVTIKKVYNSYAP